jgi:FKBP-type peptidyl-prolyl cis-trans isomerase
MKTRSMIPSALIVSLLGAWSPPSHAAPAPKRSQASADAEKDRKAGEAFLARNAAADGVVALESGLQYKVLRAGDGRKPTLDDTVVVHYRGALVDGTEFGSSYRTGQPGSFPLRAAIAGWREALQLMPAGSRWQLFVPPHLAYGERGGGGAIGPNATLIFEVELISVRERAGGPAAAAAVAIRGIEVSFKLDPRLTRSLFLGDRWVSPATFSAPAQGKTATVRASARGIDESGKRVGIEPAWIAADPGMVQVTRHGGGDVSITVKRAGASQLAVVFQGITKKLAVEATRRGDGLAVEISQ